MSDEQRVIAVVGFPRCGSSLLMRMLHVGGLEVVADNEASYESDLANPMNADFEFLRGCRGKAVKLLEPQRMRLPHVPFDFLWCLRNSEEQGKSQVKFLEQVARLRLGPSEATAARMAQGIAKDTRPAMEQLMKVPGARMAWVQFERVLEEPLMMAESIRGFLGRELKTEAMAAEVRRRSPMCYPGFLELEWAERGVRKAVSAGE